MRVFNSLIFLTLVLSLSGALAAPQTKTITETTPYRLEEIPELKVAKGFESKDPVFNLALGILQGNIVHEGRQETVYHLSVRHLNSIAMLGRVEYQLDLTTNSIFGFYLGKKWDCCMSLPHEPYLRLSAGTFIKSADELGGLVEFRRWRARAALGFGNQWFAEIGSGLAYYGLDIFALVGFAF